MPASVDAMPMPDGAVTGGAQDRSVGERDDPIHVPRVRAEDGSRDLGSGLVGDVSAVHHIGAEHVFGPRRNPLAVVPEVVVEDDGEPRSRFDGADSGAVLRCIEASPSSLEFRRVVEIDLQCETRPLRDRPRMGPVAMNSEMLATGIAAEPKTLVESHESPHEAVRIDDLRG